MIVNTTNPLIFASSKSHTTKAHTMIIEKNYSGSLDLQGTQITALPEGLTVGCEPPFHLDVSLSM